MSKTCKTCGEEKDLLHFYKKTKSSYRSECKKCGNARTKEWVENNKIRRREISLNSAKKYKNKRVESVVKYQENNPEIYLYNSAKNRSMKTGVEFSISLEDIIIPEVCPIFKTPFVRNTDYSASLDKIDPSLGYVKGNIQVISRKANTMKSNASREELKQFAEWVLND